MKLANFISTESETIKDKQTIQTLEGSDLEILELKSELLEKEIYEMETSLESLTETSVVGSKTKEIISILESSNESETINEETKNKILDLSYQIIGLEGSDDQFASLESINLAMEGIEVSMEKIKISVFKKFMDFFKSNNKLLASYVDIAKKNSSRKWELSSKFNEEKFNKKLMPLGYQFSNVTEEAKSFSDYKTLLGFYNDNMLKILETIEQVRNNNIDTLSNFISKFNLEGFKLNAKSNSIDLTDEQKQKLEDNKDKIVSEVKNIISSMKSESEKILDSVKDLKIVTRQGKIVTVENNKEKANSAATLKPLEIDDIANIDYENFIKTVKESEKYKDDKEEKINDIYTLKDVVNGLSKTKKSLSVSKLVLGSLLILPAAVFFSGFMFGLATSVTASVSIANLVNLSLLGLGTNIGFGSIGFLLRGAMKETIIFYSSLAKAIGDEELVKELQETIKEVEDKEYKAANVFLTLSSEDSKSFPLFVKWVKESLSAWDETNEEETSEEESSETPEEEMNENEEK